MFEPACREILLQILNHEITSDRELDAAKKRVSAKYKLPSLPKNSEILLLCSTDERARVIHLLQRKSVRTISGVAVVAVMTSPYPCPHGACIPCPGGPASVFRTPQSYMGREPAAMRAIQCDYDPYEQVAVRLRQLRSIGHPVDKVELIVMGGTFTARPPDYQQWFVGRSISAMNDFGGAGVADPDTDLNTDFNTDLNTDLNIKSIIATNEIAAVRNIGITFETRPDHLSTVEIDRLLEIGATKVEVGVQSIYDRALKKINRGHTVQDAIAANKRLRDSGLKVGFHIMIGLPGSDASDDLNMFKTLFSDPSFCPDHLKIYPTLVTEGTVLHQWWKDGSYQSLDNDSAVGLLADIKSVLPKWVRLQRIQRDIPAQQIAAGVTKSNIRQLAEEQLRSMGGSCRCIRCREVGHASLRGRTPDKIELLIETYSVCGGTENFISFEDEENSILIGFLRLRFPDSPHRVELTNAALVRELVVYGRMASLGAESSPRKDQWQHRGYGRELLASAEDLASGNGFSKIAVTSGIGVREYYRARGYVRDGAYMVKYI
ncbi:MAG: tRNA uridine(34) 5-carboxymethylaminomethyl modification radical SAM/GNAT enzyme Elp3 [Candidatus Methanogaster sp.]|uniref:tRNA uridine(34) 5-carboxymethylaminomethyl modification radical SAM/GNAT enzyme Elp3 n=1 Tax=Candidatus Methanogaster sp. TaxID=3386292 RepID=A0AC61L0U6_9EURY|nr:MAG: tRNA uridine(34) 5-carboxymethylaminomethyl modification radical SAM/GNAT enzyme Elp3 [ANME-2 cluster archaeon]